MLAIFFSGRECTYFKLVAHNIQLNRVRKISFLKAQFVSSLILEIEICLMDLSGKDEFTSLVYSDKDQS